MEGKQLHHMDIPPHRNKAMGVQPRRPTLFLIRATRPHSNSAASPFRSLGPRHQWRTHIASVKGTGSGRTGLGAGEQRQEHQET